MKLSLYDAISSRSFLSVGDAKYHPQNQHDDLQTQFDAFVHQINTSLTQGSTDFAFARVVAYAWNKREYLINLVDRRNPVPTTDLQNAEDLEKRVNEAVFPACQGGPHNNVWFSI